ncbi:hypothetical protein GCM10010833_02610 [Blastomonas aquatica]|uniref:Uncharacterized protein n=1 Tax=Blastomonas aquatica TaxID=1510276 RepID=A0ABQ1ISE5_9SPHN|nr:hypothetical protein GCM10010833_02610 [Blastomonas aquatica]
MLKEVMLGSGGIMLAAAMFASSFSPRKAPASEGPSAQAPVDSAPVAATPAPALRMAGGPPVSIFPEGSGDVDFGAPMIEAAPVESGQGVSGAITAAPDTAPDTAEASGGRQFYARPDQPNPIPR